MANDIILQTQGLTKEFLGFAAVSKVDLKVQRGSIHALIGPNGAGKTTVFNLLTKFIQPTQGRIQFNGVPTALAAGGDSEVYVVSYAHANHTGDIGSMSADFILARLACVY